MLDFFFFKKIKKLKLKLIVYSGRNFLGRICVFHKEGGRRRLYIKIDFFRRLNTFGIILLINKSMYHTGYLGLILYKNGLLSYIIIADTVIAGDNLFSGFLIKNTKVKYDIKTGSAIPVKYIKLFINVYCIEQYPFCGFILARSAGTKAIIVADKEDKVTLKLNSGWLIDINEECIACIGQTSNISHKYERIKNAGAARYLGIRPSSRGVVKNPCDHPHGGGEGKGSPPKVPLTPWGKPTKWTHTTDTKIAKIRRRTYKKL